VLPGVIGMLQATEVIKLLLGRGEPLVGRLLVYDALSLEFRTFKISRDPDCVVCGPNPKITAPIDYEAFCAASAGTRSGPSVPEITAHELALRLSRPDPPLLVDVREPWEDEAARIPGARLMPLGALEGRLGELEAWREKPIVIHCHHGGRSRKACELLLGRGFARVENLAGGIDAWSQQVDPSVPRY
jgi:adenylyltransferase/sulfurtransferase